MPPAGFIKDPASGKFVHPGLVIPGATLEQMPAKKRSKAASPGPRQATASSQEGAGVGPLGEVPVQPRAMAKAQVVAPPSSSSQGKGGTSKKGCLANSTSGSLRPRGPSIASARGLPSLCVLQFFRGKKILSRSSTGYLAALPMSLRRQGQ